LGPLTAASAEQSGQKSRRDFHERNVAAEGESVEDPP